MKVTERLWKTNRNNEELWRRRRKEMMERLFPQCTVEGQVETTLDGGKF